MSLSFVLKLLISQRFISVYGCRVPHVCYTGPVIQKAWLDFQSRERRPRHKQYICGGVGWCLVHLDGSVAKTRGSRTMLKSCLLAVESGSVSPKIARSFKPKRIRNGILAGHKAAKGVCRSSTLRFSLQPGERLPILNGLLPITFCSFT